MTSILERLTRIEAHLFGKAEQPKKPKFESFYVDCTREEYSDVKRILEAQGYVLYGEEWTAGENCVTTNNEGDYMTFAIALRDDNNPIYNLTQLREKFGVERPTEQPVYDAGFWFSKTHDIVLNLPDKSMIWMAYTGWAKANRGGCEPHPHTLTPVFQHTVGKFYAVKGASGEHLSDYRNYALCVAVGETVMFVRASTEYGVVLVERARERDVTLLEVTPV